MGSFPLSVRESWYNRKNRASGTGTNEIEFQHGHPPVM